MIDNSTEKKNYKLLKESRQSKLEFLERYCGYLNENSSLGWEGVDVNS